MEATTRGKYFLRVVGVVSLEDDTGSEPRKGNYPSEEVGESSAKEDNVH